VWKKEGKSIDGEKLTTRSHTGLVGPKRGDFKGEHEAKRGDVTRQDKGPADKFTDEGSSMETGGGGGKVGVPPGKGSGFSGEGKHRPKRPGLNGHATAKTVTDPGGNRRIRVLQEFSDSKDKTSGRGNEKKEGGHIKTAVKAGQSH